jgi:hypothetical protein
MVLARRKGIAAPIKKTYIKMSEFIAIPAWRISCSLVKKKSVFNP